MCISARDDSLSWPMHALLDVCSRLKELALLSHSQLVAGIVALILRSAYIFGKRSSSHSLGALPAVFGLPSFGFEEYLKEIRNNMYCSLSLTHFQTKTLQSRHYRFRYYLAGYSRQINKGNKVLPDIVVLVDEACTQR